MIELILIRLSGFALVAGFCLLWNVLKTENKGTRSFPKIETKSYMPKTKIYMPKVKAPNAETEVIQVPKRSHKKKVKP